MRVYKFIGLTHGLVALRTRRLKVSTYDNLNDPFEMLATDLCDFDVRVGFIAKKKQLDSIEGFISFSKSWTNNLLWSHYAESHRGIVLGFDVPNELLYEVRYSSQRLKLDLKSPDLTQSVFDDFVEKLRYTKSECWKYEDEARMFLTLKRLYRNSELYFSDFSENMVLREVILGLNCKSSESQMNALLRGSTNEGAVKRASMSSSSFAIVEE